MSFSIAEPKTAAQFVARLTPLERILIVNASTTSRLDYLRQVTFIADMVSFNEMMEAKIIVDREYRDKSAETFF